MNEHLQSADWRNGCVCSANRLIRDELGPLADNLPCGPGVCEQIIVTRMTRLNGVT
jgi:hypothetical protein